MIYNMHNLVSVEVDEQSTIFPSFDKRLNKFASESKCKRNITFRQDADFYLEGSCSIGAFGDYAFDSSHIYIRLRNGYVKLHKNLSTNSQMIEYEKSVEGEAVFNLFELLFRRQLLEEGFSLTHASCVGRKDKAYVFVAWAYTGKTNMLLYMLRNGLEYLSDDKIILSRDGYAYPYTLTLNLFDYNVSVHPWLKDNLIGKHILKNLRFRGKSWVKSRLEFLIRNRNVHSRIVNFLASKAYFFINSSLFPPIDPESIDVGVKLDKREISSVFILIRESGRVNAKIEEMKNLEEECKRITAINDSEDNTKITNREFAFRFAFPDMEKAANEVEILKSALENRRIFRVYLPEDGATKEACELVYNHMLNL